MMTPVRLAELLDRARSYPYGDERRLATIELCREIKELQADNAALRLQRESLVAQLQATGLVEKTW